MYAAISANGIAMTFVARRSCRALRRWARMMISAIRYSCPSCCLNNCPQLRGRPKIVPQLKLVLVFQERATALAVCPPTGPGVSGATKNPARVDLCPEGPGCAPELATHRRERDQFRKTEL